jgi:hypothetical protein
MCLISFALLAGLAFIAGLVRVSVCVLFDTTYWCLFTASSTVVGIVYTLLLQVFFVVVCICWAVYVVVLCLDVVSR